MIPDLTCYGDDINALADVASDFDLRSTMGVTTWLRSEWQAIAETLGFAQQLAAMPTSIPTTDDRIAATNAIGLAAFERSQARVANASVEHARVQSAILRQLAAAASRTGELWRVAADPTTLQTGACYSAEGGRSLRAFYPDTAPGYGWPLGERTWINPSPNAPNLPMARCYAGTVMLEGTTLSEGRGTTRPLEGFGAPDIDARALLAAMQALAPHWLDGCRLREYWFEPTFHKHAGKLCHGLQIHVEDGSYRHEAFRPWRVQALAFKAIRRLYPDYPLWRDFAYEYEHERLAIDLINGSPLLRDWVDDPTAGVDQLEHLACHDEAAWREERQAFLLY